MEVRGRAADRLRRASEELRSAGTDVKWVRTDQFHMTMAFLGEVPDERASAAASALDRAVEGRGPVSASFHELGAFPSWKRPKVIWAGVGEGAEALGAAAESLHRELRAEGFELEDRPFQPHATLGRVRSPKSMLRLSERARPWRDPGAWEGARFDVDEILLIQSRLSSAGPSYTTLRAGRLAG